MRGQAFVTFKEITQSTDAIHALQKFPFMGKNLDIHFAKTTTGITGKRRGELKSQTKEEAKGKEKKLEIPQPGVTNILKVVDLPKETTSAMLETLFKQYPGYRRGTLLPDNAWAFIKNDTDDQATVALKG